MASSERFHKADLDEFYRIAFRKKICGSIADLSRSILIAGSKPCNEQRPHKDDGASAKRRCRPSDATPLGKAKMIAA